MQARNEQQQTKTSETQVDASREEGGVGACRAPGRSQEGDDYRCRQDEGFSRSVLPEIPDYYRDTLFTCKDCGEQELWTDKQQKRWYEEKGGEIEAIDICCRA